MCGAVRRGVWCCCCCCCCCCVIVVFFVVCAVFRVFCACVLGVCGCPVVPTSSSGRSSCFVVCVQSFASRRFLFFFLQSTILPVPMKWQFLAFAGVAAADLAVFPDFPPTMHPYDPLPETTTPAELVEASTTRHPYDPLPTTTQGSVSACDSCLKRQSSGENVSCGSVCSIRKSTRATTTTSSAAPYAMQGEVCYSFCETTGEMIERDCGKGLTCTAVGGVGFDTCGNRASTCQYKALTDLGAEGEVCFQYCDDGSLPYVDRGCEKGLSCQAASGSGATYESANACGDAASTCQAHDLSSCNCQSWQTCSCQWWSCSCADMID